MDQIDASVAPPKLITSVMGKREWMRSLKFKGNQSPLNNTNRKFSSLASVSNNICINAGTEFQMVI